MLNEQEKDFCMKRRTISLHPYSVPTPSKWIIPVMLCLYFAIAMMIPVLIATTDYSISTILFITSAAFLIVVLLGITARDHTKTKCDNNNEYKNESESDLVQIQTNKSKWNKITLISAVIVLFGICYGLKLKKKLNPIKK